MDDKVVRVAAHEEHGHRRVTRLQALCQFGPARTRHHDIRDDQVECPVFILIECPCFLWICEIVHSVTQFGQDLGGEVAYTFLVLNQQDSFDTML